jgi:hypothetical protein
MNNKKSGYKHCASATSMFLALIELHLYVLIWQSWFESSGQTSVTDGGYRCCPIAGMQVMGMLFEIEASYSEPELANWCSG